MNSADKNCHLESNSRPCQLGLPRNIHSFIPSPRAFASCLNAATRPVAKTRVHEKSKSLVGLMSGFIVPDLHRYPRVSQRQVVKIQSLQKEWSTILKNAVGDHCSIGFEVLLGDVVTHLTPPLSRMNAGAVALLLAVKPVPNEISQRANINNKEFTSKLFQSERLRPPTTTPQPSPHHSSVKSVNTNIFGTLLVTDKGETARINTKTNTSSGWCVFVFGWSFILQLQLQHSSNHACVDGTEQMNSCFCNVEKTRTWSSETFI